ncbi:hypothetical protein ACFYNZ_16615 [Streptomyces kebangsaanensis]|uniref:Uncharacterized protein n=1 Tax=Streptomyces kebangsaanensis TaxID=864058 RepID=A0ABW6KTA9_9ACTN
MIGFVDAHAASSARVVGMSEEESIPPPGNGHDRRRDVIAAVITCSAIGAAIVHMVKPDLKIDAVTAALLAVAVVPWLGALFESIELPGGTKFQYKQLVDRIQAAEEHTTRAGHAADDASRTARLAFVATGSADHEGPPGSTVSETIAQLATEYTQVRDRMESGPERTSVMEQIFANLVTATRREHDFDIERSLKSDNPGTRLAAYARLYGRPEADHLDTLIEAVLGDEQRAFSQYWGFQAISTIVDAAGVGRIRLGDVDKLETCLSRLPRDSDRIGVLARLIAKVRAR